MRPMRAGKSPFGVLPVLPLPGTTGTSEKQQQFYPMDKILLTAFLSALAGFITAILSIVKLVNDKESKTTDYRQGWTDSVRTSFANLVALINSSASEIARAKGTTSTLVRLLGNSDMKDADRARGLDFNEKLLQEEHKRIRDTRGALYEAYALTRLHFKPNDLSFNRIEQKFDVAMSLLNDLGKEDKEPEQQALKERIHAVAAEITDYGRDILKDTWETVKRGEPAYRSTIKWSIWGSYMMLFLLVSIGIHAAIAVWKSSVADQGQTPAGPAAALQSPAAASAPASSPAPQASSAPIR